MLAAAALLSACTAPPPRFQGSFLQPWKSHESLSIDEWRRRLRITRALGCGEIVLQWSALYGGAFDWAPPDSLLAMLFEEAAREGMGIRMGLPYDEGWWKAMGSKDPAVLPSLLATARDRCLPLMESARWPKLPGFRGWYLPYEIDQYNWATAERRGQLVDWLDGIATVARRTGGQPLAVSTFFSRLPTEGSLAELWSQILDRVPLRPMLQDGVGVAGIDNLAGLEPLRALLRRRGVAFDLVVELFEQLPAAPGGEEGFKARAATPERVRRQMEIARGYGAERVIAFAIDPWMVGDTPEAKRLLEAWGVAF